MRDPVALAVPAFVLLLVVEWVAAAKLKHGTYLSKDARPRYGLTKPVETYNIVRLQTREYEAIARDVRSANGLRAKLGYVFGPPGWTPGGVSVQGGAGTVAPRSGR